jgi:uncharacterized protein YbdZ (MbtH family)
MHHIRLCLLRLFALCLLLTAFSTAHAQTTVYNSRAAYLAALDRYQTETFTAPGTDNGTIYPMFDYVSLPRTVGRIGVGNTNNLISMLVTGYSGTATVSFPAPVTAFGADFVVSSNQTQDAQSGTASVSIGGTSYPLPKGTTTPRSFFFGVISTQAFSSVVFSLQSTGVDGGNGAPGHITLTMDNAAFRPVSTILGKILETRDFNGDFAPDFLYTIDEKPTYLYTQTAADVTTIASQGVTTPAPTSGWQVKRAGRFAYGMTTPDLVLTHPTDRRVHFWHMNGTTRTGGEYVYYTTQTDLHLTLPPNTEILGAEDFDEDQRDDLVWFDPATRQIGVWSMRGASFYSGAYLNKTLPAGWKIVGLGRVDYNPYPELLLQSPTRELHIWYFNGFNWYSGSYVLNPANNARMILPAGWEVAGMADFNRDGLDEIVLQNRVENKVEYWKLNYNLYYLGKVSVPIP